MLQYICEERILSQHTKIVLHYLVRRRDEALFIDILSKVKQHFGGYFQGHLWITRQEAAVTDPYLSPDNALQVHSHLASSGCEVSQPWEWWDSFSSSALEYFDTKEKRDKSLVYICGPQGLTDRLVEMYKERGLNTVDGHVQVEKWW